MLTSNQRGRGQEPVTVLGRIAFAVMVNMTGILLIRPAPRHLVYVVASGFLAGKH